MGLARSSGSVCPQCERRQFSARPGACRSSRSRELLRDNDGAADYLSCAPWITSPHPGTAASLRLNSTAPRGGAGYRLEDEDHRRTRSAKGNCALACYLGDGWCRVRSCSIGLTLPPLVYAKVKRLHLLCEVINCVHLPVSRSGLQRDG